MLDIFDADTGVRIPKRELLGDQVDAATLEAKLGKNHRQLLRLIARGMPYIPFGRERLFSLSAVEAWLADQQTSRRQPPPPRGRGRPRLRPR